MSGSLLSNLSLFHSLSRSYWFYTVDCNMGIALSLSLSETPPSHKHTHICCDMDSQGHIVLSVCVRTSVWPQGVDIKCYPINHNGPHRATFCQSHIRVCVCVRVCKHLCLDQMSVKQLLSLFGHICIEQRHCSSKMFPIRPNDSQSQSSTLKCIKNIKYTKLIFSRYYYKPTHTLTYYMQIAVC